MSLDERALVFPVEGMPVVGILHCPSRAAETAIVMLAAGGPQYRAGCCRQLVAQARQFAEAGIAVMRFDTRGMGESGGEYRDFRRIEPDLRAAIDQVMAQLPTVKRVLLWGGCNAASAAMMYAWQDARVRGLVVSNPRARRDGDSDRQLMKHYYLHRLKDRRFWAKMLRRGISPAALGNFLKVLLPGGHGDEGAAASGTVEAPAGGDFVERMREGLARFDGEILLLLSGRSVLGREFEVTATSSRAWRKAVARARITRRRLPDSDHNFSSREARDALFGMVMEWLHARGW